MLNTHEYTYMQYQFLLEHGPHVVHQILTQRGAKPDNIALEGSSPSECLTHSLYMSIINYGSVDQFSRQVSHKILQS